MEKVELDSRDVVPLVKTESCWRTGEKILQVDLDALRKVLGNPEYKDHFVAIYTIVGPTRSGKSFLLNLFWNFLHQNEEKSDCEKWSKNNKKVSEIFNWKRGAKPYTQGIYILKKPIIVSSEEKIALFLMDTQGMYDYDSSHRNQVFLGTFSFLLSSFVLFNVVHTMETIHLKSICKFATNLRNSDGSFFLQKESLMFVIRDWFSAESDSDSDDEDHDYAYGTDGGSKYFNELFSDDFLHEATEHRIMIDFLEDALGKNMSCCLLPYPGNAVVRTSCRVADLNDEFQRESFKLFQEINSDCQRRIKTFNGHLLKCGTLCEIISEYVYLLGPQLGEAYHESFVEKHLQVKMSRHVERCIDEFASSAGFQRVLEGSYDTFQKHRQELNANLKLKFRQETIQFYSESIVGEWEKKLSWVFSKMIQNLMTCKHVEEAFKKAIMDYFEWLKNNANDFVEYAETFSDQSREKRDSLLQELEVNIHEKFEIGSEKDSLQDLEEIVLQCQEYFIDRISHINESIDNAIKSAFQRTGLNAALGRASIFLLPFSILYEIRHHNTAKALATQKILTIIDANIPDSSPLVLQQYKEGRMTVKVSFGTLKFKLGIGDVETDAKSRHAKGGNKS